jgi:hypothetical protein
MTSSSVRRQVVIGVDFGALSGRAVVVAVDDGAELGSAVHEYPHGAITRPHAYVKLWKHHAAPGPPRKPRTRAGRGRMTRCTPRTTCCTTISAGVATT